MLKVLSKCIREYKQASLKAPLMVSLEVVMECIIPFIIAQLVNRMKAGAGFREIAMYGLVLVIMATLSLIFGITAGNACATASCGFAKNVRKDLFYKIQDFSFENIDRFSSSSLVTRLTTDVTNVQMAYMMIVRIAYFCFCHGIYHGRQNGMYFYHCSAHTGNWSFFHYPPGYAAVPRCI